MAAHPIVVIDHGKVDIPAELRQDPRYRDGAKLQLVPILDATWAGENSPQGDWRRLRGILAECGVDLNAELKAERVAEENRLIHGLETIR